MLLIGISGAARAGKDTLARVIKHVLPNTTLMAFAYAVKLQADPICKEKFGLSAFTEIPEQKKIIRQVLIDVGHGSRTADPMIWINKLAVSIDRVLPEKNIIVTDVRYENEAAMIHSKGGIVIFVERNDQASIPTEQESLRGVKWDIKIDMGSTNIIPIMKAMFPLLSLA